MARVSEKEIIMGNLLDLWNLYAENYRNALSTYNELLHQKVLRNMKPLRAVKMTVLKEWKDVEFFNISDEKEVIEFLKEKEVKELKFLERELHKTLESYEYITVMNAIKEFKNEIYRFDCQDRRKKALGGRQSVVI